MKSENGTELKVLTVLGLFWTEHRQARHSSRSVGNSAILWARNADSGGVEPFDMLFDFEFYSSNHIMQRRIRPSSKMREGESLRRGEVCSLGNRLR
ncbi:hypothetical protein BDR22DRAFT_828887 [Usnea florida]